MRAVGRVHYAWVVAGISFVTLLVGAGIRATPSVLIVPLEREFGWSSATIGFAIAVNLFLFGLAGPFAAAVMERFGLRRTVVAALAIMAVGVGLTSMMREAWQLTLLWGVLVGSCTGVTGMVLGATVAARWFQKRRGLVTGALTASTATGQLVFLPGLAALAETDGWRAVSLVMAVVALALIAPVWLLLRDFPVDAGLAPYGDPGPPQPRPPRGRNPALRAVAALREAAGVRDFWLLAGSFFICGASTNGLIGTHLIAACTDHGLSEVTGAGLLAAMGVFDFFGTTGSGWLTDRLDSRLLLAWYYGLRGLSLMFLPFALDGNFWGLSVFTVFYGLDWIATVPPTVRLAGGLFGEQNVGVFFGWIAAFHQFGAASAAWAAGLIRADTGDYFSAFEFSGGLCLVASILVSLIRTQRRVVQPA
jgi:predicted MFS family arabinose efflux permease